MNHVFQITLGRSAAKVRRPFECWREYKTCKTAITLLQRTSDLCRELSLVVYHMAHHSKSRDRVILLDVLESASLLSVVANTSCDPDADWLCKRWHLSDLPSSSSDADPFTPLTLPVNLVDLIDSCCHATDLDQRRALSLLRDLASITHLLAQEVCRLTLDDDCTYIGELTAAASALVRACNWQS